LHFSSQTVRHKLLQFFSSSEAITETAGYMQKHLLPHHTWHISESQPGKRCDIQLSEAAEICFHQSCPQRKRSRSCFQSYAQSQCRSV